MSATSDGVDWTVAVDAEEVISGTDVLASKVAKKSVMVG